MDTREQFVGKHHHQSEKDPTHIYETILVVLLGLVFFLFPLLFSSHFTSAFLIPKQILLLGVVLLSLIVWGVQMLHSGKITFRRTPCDVPLLLFASITFLSAIVSINRYDALMSYIPTFCLFVLYFLIIQTVRRETTFAILVAALLLGGSLVSLYTFFSLLHIYLLPFSYAHTQSFSPLGSYLEQALYLLFLLPIAGWFAYPLFKGTMRGKELVGVISFVLHYSCTL